MTNVVHITHEAVHKVGGIGTVLEGLINSAPYRDSVGRTVLVCPLFYPEDPQRLGPGAVIEYSSLDQIYGSPYQHAFRRIEQEYHVRLVYGQRPIEDEASSRRTVCEVLLVDLRGINHHRICELKAHLWEHYGLQSHRYEHIWEFEQYVELAAPAAAALDALQVGGDRRPAIAFAHEFMGIPTALALALYHPRRYRTLFHAHEVAPVRRLVEQHPGHDVMFYNALELGRKNQLYLEDVFGPQHDYFKYAVVDGSRYCDGTLAVGNLVVRELQFLGRRFEEGAVHLAYNGVPSAAIKLKDRQRSRGHLRDYCHALLGWRPDWVFTHVTRLAVSKALWRDLDVLAELDGRLAAAGQTAVLLVLSTELPRRPPADILRMEREWDWPLAHREGSSDLTGGETAYYQLVQAFNLRARNVRVVFINQFGLNAASGGQRVPEELEFMDLRRGTDLEFGLSLYEPFGISPFEPLTFGGLCAVSTSCGCAGFFAAISEGVGVAAGGAGGAGRVGGAGGAAGASVPANVLIGDYIHAGAKPRSIKEAIEIDAPQRREVERQVAVGLAEQIMQRLPKTPAEQEALIKTGYELARRMSWDAVAQRFIFPAIQKATARRQVLSLA